MRQERNRKDGSVTFTRKNDGDNIFFIKNLCTAWVINNIKKGKNTVLLFKDKFI